MLFIISVSLSSLVILLLLHFAFLLRLSRLKADGVYPAMESSATNEDVKTLLRLGYRIEAIRLYRRVNKKGLADAVRETGKLNVKGSPIKAGVNGNKL